MIFIGNSNARTGYKQRGLGRRIFLGPNSFKFLVIFVLAAFSLFYLSQSSQSATKNYIVSDLEQQKNDVAAETERLEIEANRLKALSIIQENAAQKGMEQASQ